eukprot:3851465-Pyramimonas_sp.AAC.1
MSAAKGSSRENGQGAPWLRQMRAAIDPGAIGRLREACRPSPNGPYIAALDADPPPHLPREAVAPKPDAAGEEPGVDLQSNRTEEASDFGNEWP